MTSDVPSASELGIDAELLNALMRRVMTRTRSRTGDGALFSTRRRAACIAVMALDAATDEWMVGYESRQQAEDLRLEWFGSAPEEPT